MTVLSEADELIYGDRNNDYGHPRDDFGRTARIWTAILGTEVNARQVALCLIGVKISRLCQTPDHRDSIVDIAGYAGCYDRVVTGE